MDAKHTPCLVTQPRLLWFLLIAYLVLASPAGASEEPLRRPEDVVAYARLGLYRGRPDLLISQVIRRRGVAFLPTIANRRVLAAASLPASVMQAIEDSPTQRFRLRVCYFTARSPRIPGSVVRDFADSLREALQRINMDGGVGGAFNHAKTLSSDIGPATGAITPDDVRYEALLDILGNIEEARPASTSGSPRVLRVTPRLRYNSRYERAVIIGNNDVLQGTSFPVDNHGAMAAAARRLAAQIARAIKAELVDDARSILGRTR